MYIFWKHCPQWANTTKDMNYHHINLKFICKCILSYQYSILPYCPTLSRGHFISVLITK